MKSKTVQVHFRASENERQKIHGNAAKCGLGASEYLRQLAIGYKPKPLPPIEYRELKDMITDLYLEYNERGETKYSDLLVEVLRDMAAAISPNV